jgi:hypothetical protein
MTTTTAPPAGPPTARRSRLPLVVLAVLAAVVVLERAHTYRETPERDIGGYAMFADEMLRHGRPLYADLWERKPPGLFVSYMAAELVVGYGRQQIFLLNVTAALAVLAGTYAAGRAVGGTTGGLLAAAGWAIVGGDLYLEANQPNAELPLNACLTAAVAVLVWWPARPRSRRAATVAVGCLFAAATLYKHHVVVTCGCLAAAHVLAGGRSGRGRRAVEAVAALAVVPLAWAGVVGYFAAVGRLDPFLQAMFRENVSYGGDFRRNLVVFFQPHALWGAFAAWAVGPIVLLAAAAAARAVRPPAVVGDRRPWVIWIAWAVGAWPAVALPGRFYYHYYQYWLPILAVGGGWAAAALLRALPGRTRPSGFTIGVVVLAFTIMVLQEGPAYLLPADEWARRKATGNLIEPQRHLGDWLVRTLGPGETFWNDGQDTNLYFLARRSPPTGLLSIDPVLYGPDAPRLQRRQLADVATARPDLVIVSPYMPPLVPPDWPIDRWISDHYDWLPSVPGDEGYRLAVRKGSDLARRLRRAGSTSRP